MAEHKLYVTHISVWYGYSGDDQYGWWAKLHWQDNRWCETGTVEGDIRTCYGDESMSSQIDHVLGIACQFGLDESAVGGMPIGLYYIQDGDSKEYPPPAGWRETLQAERKRRGW